MNKRGFTLVELLAVIAILAILVIIALPNVLSMFNSAKKDMFLTEAKNIYKEVSKKYISETMKGNQINKISNDNNKLDMESNNLEYNIKLDDKGNIKKFQVSDGTYCLSGKFVNLNELTIDKIKEGKCEEAVPISFKDDEWDIIIDAVRMGRTDKYNVGDTKKVDMGSYGVHTVRISNISNVEECKSNDFSQSACGFVIEFQDIISMHNMNPAGIYKEIKYDYGWNKDGYPVTSLRSYLNNEIYNSLPSELRDGIINTTVISSYGSEDNKNFISTDKIYLLSSAEVWKQEASNMINNDSAREVTRQLDYYNKFNVSSNNYSYAKKINKDGKSYWWLRSANSDYNDIFYVVSTSGEWSSQSASAVLGVSPAFRIG